MSEKNGSTSNLFKNIKYKISGVVLDEIIELLKNGGAEGFSYFSDYVTHCIIGDKPSEIDICDANDLYEVPAITSDWVILSAKCGKLLPIKGFTYEEGRIFSGVVVSISQLSAADARAIWAMIKYHGGKCSLKFDSNTTHLVVGKATGAKYDRVFNSTKENFCSKIYPVTPDWVLDSIRNGSRCLENLYHPRLLIEKQSRLSEIVGGLSTAYIAGFCNVNVPPEENTAAPNVSSEVLEQLKQRMPWNRSTPTASLSVTSNSQQTPNSKCFQSMPASAILELTSNQVAAGQPKLLQQQQALLQHLPKELAPSSPQPLPPQEQLQKQQLPQPMQQRRILIPQQFLQQGVSSQWTPPHNFAHQFQQIQPEQQEIQLQQHKLLQQRVQQQVKPQFSLSQQVKTDPQQFKLQNSQAHQLYVNTTSVTTPGQLTWQNTQTQQQTKPYQHTRQEAQQKQPGQPLKLQQIQKRMTKTQSRPGPTGGGGLCRQLIHMDAQIYAHLLQMDPQQRALFHQGLQDQRQLVLQRQFEAQQQECQITRFVQAGPVAASGSSMVEEVQSSQLTTELGQTAVKSATATPVIGLAQTCAQFYGHNPNSKLPPGMCLLGCIFLIVEYDRIGFDVHTWQRVIIKNGGDVEASYSLRVTHILCQTQKHPLVQQGLRDGKRCITADWLSDVILKQQLLPPWLALHLPTPFSDEKPCHNLIISYSGFKGEERIWVKKMIETIGAKITSYFSSHNHILGCRRPEGKKYRKAREWGKSVVNVQWLNEILLGHYSCLQEVDSHKYQQFNLRNPFRIDYTLVPHLMAAWKLPINITQESYDRVKSRPPLTDRRKRPCPSNSSLVIPDPDQENKELACDIQEAIPNPPLPNRRPYIMFSRVENIAEKQRKVWQLGGIVAKNCSEATHLLMSKPQRTFKLLCCLSTCKYIVSLNWLLDSYDQNTFLDEANYTFSDSEVEKTYNFSICDVLKNPERRELFKGKTFYLSPGVFPSPLALREIIQCAGGTVDRKRKSLRQIQEAEPYTYLIVTVSNDLHLVADVLHANIGVYNTEFVMSAVMKQHIDYDSAFKLSHVSKNS